MHYRGDDVQSRVDRRLLGRPAGANRETGARRHLPRVRRRYELGGGTGLASLTRDGVDNGRADKSARPLVGSRSYIVASRGMGLSAFWMSPLVSPVDEMSSAPVCSRIRLARDDQSELSEWTDSRMPPFFTRPS